MIHFGLSIEAYAIGMASLARWPEQRALVFARLAIAEQRWEQAASAFRVALVQEAERGGDELAARFRECFEAARAELERERPDVQALAPLPIHAAPAAAHEPLAATAEVDQHVLQRALHNAGGPARAQKSAALPPVTVKAPGPFVPGALPFAAATDDEIEAYAQLTSDLDAFPGQLVDVLKKHRLTDADALVAERARWAKRFEQDERTRQHWLALHQSLLGYLTRQRDRGQTPCL